MKRLIVVIFAFTVLPAQGADVKPAPAPAEPAASAPAAAAPEAAPAGTVARSQFTTAVQDREPVDKVTSLINDKTRVYFFTEIKDAANHRVTHRWEHDGKVVSEVGFDIGGDRWRVYSSKTLDPAQTGEWKVSVVDESGQTLGTSAFTYEAAPAATSQPAASQPSAPAAVQ
jgi:hypothetical protein